MLLSYLRFALGIFLIFTSYIVLFMIYAYPNIWYSNCFGERFRRAKLFSTRFSLYFILNNLAAPLIIYLVTLVLIVVDKNLPFLKKSNGNGNDTDMLTFIFFPMLMGFLASPIIAYFNNFNLLEPGERDWTDIIFLALSTIIFYIFLYHFFQRFFDIQTTRMLLEDSGWV